MNSGGTIPPDEGDADERPTEVIGIAGISSAGAGVGRESGGRVLFVHRTAPGDRVRVAGVKGKARWATARLTELVEEGEGRRYAPCPLYDRCGGCTLQHMEYPVQLRAKEELVREALRRIGGIATDPRSIVPSPREFRYRNRMTFTLLRLPRGRVIAGLHSLEMPGRIVDVRGECLLPEPELMNGWMRLREGWGEGARFLPGGTPLRLTLRTLDEGFTLLVRGGRGPGAPEELLRRVPGLRSIWSLPRGGGADSPVRARLLAGEPAPMDARAGLPVAVRGAAFNQVNRYAAAAILPRIRSHAGAVAGRRVIDAYCGTGLYGRDLASRGADVTGIELDPDAAEAVVPGTVGAGERPAGALPSPGGSFTMRQGRTEDELAGLLPADLVIVNPPRTGLDPKVCTQLLEAGSGRILYLSCDPATLARDLRLLSEGFRPSAVETFDLFPQTAHVETLVVLEPLNRPSSLSMNSA